MTIRCSTGRRTFRLSREITIPFWDTTPPDNPTTNAGATLGRVLFYDKRVSVTNTHSCGSCHEQQRGFTVGTPFAAGATGELSRRNPMALANARYNIHGFYFGDMRAMGLEELALMPIEDPIELGNNLPAVIAKLAATDFYPPLFAAAFGSEGITADRISRAIAQFLRSILSYRSKFDRGYHYVYPPAAADPTTVLTSQELLGAEMFVGGLCGHCHGNGVHTNDRPPTTASMLSSPMPVPVTANFARHRSGTSLSRDRTCTTDALRPCAK